MSRPNFPLAIVLSVLALTLLMLPSLSGCSSSGHPTEPGVTDFNRETFFEPIPGMKHFTIQPVGPSGMFGQEGYSPICEDSQPVFSVRIYAPSDGPMANIVNVTIHTTIDGQKVENKVNPITGTVDFSPSTPLLTGRHIAVIQLTLDDNAYPPLVRDWMFDVYNEPPRITSILVDDAKRQAVVFFNRPVPKGQIQDMSRWNINSDSFASGINAQPGQMSAIVNIGQNFAQYLDLPIPVILEFQSDKGSTTFTISKGSCGKSGSRTGQDEIVVVCAPVDEGDFTAFPGSGNPHQFFESEFSAWCYRMEVEPGYCPISSTADYTVGCIEHVFAWDELEDDCGFSKNADNPTIPSYSTNTGWFIIEEPACYDDPSCFYHTFTYSPDISISFAGEIWAENDLEPPNDWDFETYVGEAAVSFGADLINPEIIYGPYILTGWQAAREIEGLISDPGDSVFHYGPGWPETLEEHIDLLRTVWADNMFVFAGGADPGGSLFPFVPLDLDTYFEPFACPPMDFMIPTFRLWRDYPPLGALPGDEGYGDETIPWSDSMSYPLGYPVDGSAYFEELYTLWPIDGYMNAICTDPPNFSMRVRVTDHVGNWVRSGMIEEMQIGVPGVDSGLRNPEMHFYKANLNQDQKWIPEYLYEFCNNNCEACSDDLKASNIELRDPDGNCVLHIVVAAQVLNELQPEDMEGLEVTFFCIPPEMPPPDANQLVTLPLVLDDYELFSDMISFPDNPECYNVALTAHLPVSDQVPNPPNPEILFVSHRDTAYSSDPGAELCRDYTKMYNTWKDSHNVDLECFKNYAEAFVYGPPHQMRGEGSECEDGYDEYSYYTGERFIQTAGTMRVKAYFEYSAGSGPLAPRYLEEHRLVQSAADLVIIASHRFYPDEVYYNGSWNGDRSTENPTGMLGYFNAAQSGCGCPAPVNNEYYDRNIFSPLTLLTRIYDQGVPQDEPHDNDFTESSTDNGETNDSLFWQKQPCSEEVTWLVLLACGALNDDLTYGYKPRDKWDEWIKTPAEAGFYDVVCGYRHKGPGADGKKNEFTVINEIGDKFSEIMLLDAPLYPDYYWLTKPNDPYYDKPIRAWMEAHCWALNSGEVDVDVYDDRKRIEGAAAIRDHMWWCIKRHRISHIYYIVRESL